MMHRFVILSSGRIYMRWVSFLMILCLDLPMRVSIWNLKPAAYPFTFPASDPGTLSIDSVVLVLSYARTYGDTNAIQKVEVYPLLDNFKVDTNYTTCNTFNYDQNTLLGERFYYPARTY